MSILSELFEKLDDKVFWIALFDLLFLIAPGFIIIFLFREDLFREMDTWKLILFSISITGLLYFFNILLEKSFIKDKKDLFANHSVGILMTGLILYGSILFYLMFNEPSKSFLGFISIAILGEIIYIYVSFLENKMKFNFNNIQFAAFMFAVVGSYYYIGLWKSTNDIVNWTGFEVFAIILFIIGTPWSTYGKWIRLVGNIKAK